MTQFKYPDFYIHPDMLGHILAKKSLDLAIEIKNKYVKTKKQKMLYDSIINLNRENWHYWYSKDNKYLCQLRYALRHINNMTPCDLYCHIESNHSMLKSDLLRWLELYAYTHDKENFLKKYCENFIFLGMNEQDAIKRCDNYIQDLKIKYNYQV